MTLRTPIHNLKGVGASTVQKLKKLRITTIWGLLNHFPERYEDFRKIIPIRSIVPQTYACVRGKIRLLSSKRSPRRRLGLTECILEDISGSVQCIWLHQPYIAKAVSEGDTLFIAGKVSATKYGIQFINPVYEKVTTQPIHTARLVPVYPLTAKLTQRLIRSLIIQALPSSDAIKDALPESIRKKYRLMPIKEAYRVIHSPITPNHAAQARERLALQELIDLMQSIAKFTSRTRALPAHPFSGLTRQIQTRLKTLPFSLTPDQKKTLAAMVQDVSQSHPMNRMINGDVGSGKTIVAHLLADALASSGGVTTLIAPTQILANQHFESFKKFFPQTTYPTLLYTQGTRQLYRNGKTTIIRVSEARNRILSGNVGYIIGTHALLQKTVRLETLSCVIIDEQHRFGVEQRAKLLLDHQNAHQHTPHFLSLTATPIPRSYARMLLGGTDMSVLETHPHASRQIRTHVLPHAQRSLAYATIRKEIQKGNRAFVICPLIEESDTLGVASVTEESKKLIPLFSEDRLCMLHGKLSATEKEKVMRAFSSGDRPILISTTVVEVGIDVPEATVMLIEGAERFGLAQLHQLRGRIGRSTAPSICFAITSSPNQTPERLAYFENEHNGFTLAAHDLELRGPGTILGTVQSGFRPLRLSDAYSGLLIEQAQKIVQELSGSK